MGYNYLKWVKKRVCLKLLIALTVGKNLPNGAINRQLWITIKVGIYTSHN